MCLDHLLDFRLSEQHPPLVFTVDITTFYCADACLLDQNVFCPLIVSLT
jgi:hypothetical protein